MPAEKGCVHHRGRPRTGTGARGEARRHRHEHRRPGHLRGHPLDGLPQRDRRRPAGHGQAGRGGRRGDRRRPRRRAQLRRPGRVLALGLDRFGRVDVLLANAGIVRLSSDGDRDRTWTDIIDVNLTGVWRTIEVVLPAIRAGRRGGSIVITSSSAGPQGDGHRQGGRAGLHRGQRGLVGLMQVLANQYAGEMIRVNTIHPTGVATGMSQNPAMEALMAQAAAGGQNAISQMQSALPIRSSAGGHRRRGRLAGIRRGGLHHRHPDSARRHFRRPLTVPPAYR